MQNKYYYLVASLPYLRFEKKTPVSKDTFLEECRKWLSDQDLKAVRDLDIKQPDIKDGDISLVREWKAFDMALRTALAGIRKEGEHALRKEIPDVVRHILERKDPLSREKAIERVRWDFIEDEEYKYLFDINWLVFYCLKVQILERLATFELEKGKQVFQDLCEVKDEQANW